MHGGSPSPREWDPWEARTKVTRARPTPLLPLQVDAGAPGPRRRPRAGRAERPGRGADRGGGEARGAARRRRGGAGRRAGDAARAAMMASILFVT